MSRALPLLAILAIAACQTAPTTDALATDATPLTRSMDALATQIDELRRELGLLAKLMGEREERALVADLQRQHLLAQREVARLAQRYSEQASPLLQARRELADLEAQLARLPGLPASR